MQVNERYMHGHHESVLRTHSWRTVDNSAAYLAPHLKPGLNVLDVGSGPGTITVDIAARVAPGNVVGIDMEPTMETQATGLADSLGRRNVSFRTGSAYAIDAEDDTFDIVHAHQVLQHVADPVAVLREMRRVVKPGGIVAARDVIYIASSWFPLLPGLQKWMDTYQAVARTNGGDPNAGRRLKTLAFEAGFADVASTASIWCFSDAEDRDWWGSAWSVRALESSFATQAIESGVATLEDLREISRAWEDWVQDERGWFAMPHGEILARK
ncbi:Methyltransferase domain-containing protein [Paramicrobacterium humi]|uniref:Methyltransferase domain-containing protein n=1 Tax=Paramicrobacterium humi TaxID=640635 RepID=A0A1H4Q6Y3_9MICO|nr:class I SAM-dependent methyltransferase [Microbacterium humi]SEC15298.1 Methyltransferase domain-containing protein [Microbacterium humi]